MQFGWVPNDLGPGPGSQAVPVDCFFLCWRRGYFLRPDGLEIIGPADAGPKRSFGWVVGWGLGSSSQARSTRPRSRSTATKVVSQRPFGGVVVWGERSDPYHKHDPHGHGHGLGLGHGTRPRSLSHKLANATRNQWTNRCVDFRVAQNLGLKSLILCFLPTSLFLFLPFSG